MDVVISRIQLTSDQLYDDRTRYAMSSQFVFGTSYLRVLWRTD